MEINLGIPILLINKKALQDIGMAAFCEHTYDDELAKNDSVKVNC